MKNKKEGKKTAGIKIPIFFYVIIILFILSLFSVAYALFQRVSIILGKTASGGIYISIFLLFTYLYLIIYSLILISKLNQKAIKTALNTIYFGIIVLFWIDIIGPLILASQELKLIILQGVIPSLILNLIVSLTMLIYLKKSKKIRQIFSRNE